MKQRKQKTLDDQVHDVEAATIHTDVHASYVHTAE